MLSVRFPAGGIGGAFPILPRGSPRMLPPPGGKCRAQRGDRGIAFPSERLSAASPLPPSDEGGGKATGFDGGRDDWERTPALGNTSAFSAPPQSAPQTAPPLGAPCRAPLFSHASPAGGSAGRSEAIGVLPSPRSGSPLRLHCLPLTREVAKPQALTEGEMIGNALLRWGILRLFLPPLSLLRRQLPRWGRHAGRRSSHMLPPLGEVANEVSR